MTVIIVSLIAIPVIAYMLYLIVYAAKNGETFKRMDEVSK